jgi:hypothetical protein
MVVAILLCASGCGSGHRASIELPIYFTCDTRGRLEPCGCFQGQFGGLTRLKTVLDAETAPHGLRVDVGDAIAGREDYEQIEYRYMLKAFAGLKYDALNLGHREARLSAAQLYEIKRASPVPLISANVLDRATGKPIFDPWRIVQRGSFRIGLIGVLDPASLSEPAGDGLLIENMESALARHLAELRPQVDLIILLAFADEAGLARLAQRFYEAHVILGGKVRQPSQELLRENRSLLYFVTNESRALGLLRLQLAANQSPKPVANEIRLLHDKIPQEHSFRQMSSQRRARLDQVRAFRCF